MYQNHPLKLIMALRASVSHDVSRVFVLGRLIMLAVSVIGITDAAHAGLPPDWGLTQLNRSSFPNGFVFGAAASAFQIEGGASEDGRGPSIWDIFTQKYPEKIVDHSNATMADDSYHLYKDDVRLIKQIGMDAYRFSISWSRVLPLGRRSGGINEHGVAYYNNLINELRSNGIEPYVTLFHWDLPQALEDEYGGFLSSQIVDDYCGFVELCFQRFGDRVKNWITFNEPWSFSVGGYEKGFLAPGRCSSYVANCTRGDSGIEPYLVAHNQLLAHAAAVRLYRNQYQASQNGKIGITLVSQWMVPYSDQKDDQEAASRALDFDLGWFLNPLTFGDYPMTMRNQVGDRLPRFSVEESYMLRNSFDFLGLNYYTATYVQHLSHPVTANMTHSTDSRCSRIDEKNGVLIGPPSGSDWLKVFPEGMHHLLVYIKNNYSNPTIYITENGIDDINNVSSPVTNADDFRLKDDFRVRFYLDHLVNVRQAINEGVNVKGYFAWALIDNFEWDAGYSVRFGLNYVDYLDKLRRYPKFSATWFTNFLRIRN